MPADPHASRDTRPRASADGESAHSRLHPVEWTVQADAVDDVLREMDARVRRRTRRRRLSGFAGATLALVIAAGSWWQHSAQSISPAEIDDRGSVVVLQPERQVLTDGSVVALRRGARIAVEFTAARRRVAVLEGEAHFDVAKNPHRPFVVAVGPVEVRAVGTAFSVHRAEAGVEVLVSEGKVAVEEVVAPSRPSATAPLPNAPESERVEEERRSLRSLATVEAGHRVTVGHRVSGASVDVLPTVVVVPASELDARLAWRVPRLEFSGTPLAEAVELINRHGRARIEIADAALASVRISGILRADNLDTLSRLLEEEHGIRTERRSKDAVILRRGR